MAKKVKRPAKKAATAKGKKKSGKLEGEGSYTATRNYDRAQQAFVARNRARIGKLAKDAEKALEGPEGKTLRAAEKVGRAKARR